MNDTIISSTTSKKRAASSASLPRSSRSKTPQLAMDRVQNPSRLPCSCSSSLSHSFHHHPHQYNILVIWSSRFQYHLAPTQHHHQYCSQWTRLIRTPTQFRLSNHSYSLSFIDILSLYLGPHPVLSKFFTTEWVRIFTFILNVSILYRHSATVIHILVLAMHLLQSFRDLRGLLPIVSHSSISYRYAYGVAQVKLGYLSRVLEIYTHRDSGTERPRQRPRILLSDAYIPLVAAATAREVNDPWSSWAGC